MHWYIATPFSQTSSDQWLGRYVPGTRHSFSSVPARYQHDGSRRQTGAQAWADYFDHAFRVWWKAQRHSGRAGIITCFPQLPVAVGTYKGLSRAATPVVAWSFNLGDTPEGLRQKLARRTLRHVDRFVVHSRHEVGVYSHWLGVPERRFQFVPLQRGLMTAEYAEDMEQPYIISLGSARRDYRLLMEALRPLPYRTILVAGPHAVEGLDIPPHVEVRSGLSYEECRRLLQQARLSVIPVGNETTASGQVTLLDSMMFGRPTIVTDCPGSVDYVRDRHDGLLVRPGDVESMREAIEALWNDETLRAQLGAAARQAAVEHFSDEPVARRMKELLDELV